MDTVDPKTPLQIVVTSQASSIDLDKLVAFSERAWRHDYQGQLRALYDREHFEWLLNGKDWFAVLAVTESGEPVGSFVSLLRSLNFQGESFPAAYSTGWAVDPAYRRTGISLRLWQAYRATLLERGYVGMSSSHVGQAGMRAAGVLRDAPGQHRGVSIAFHTGAIWSKPLSAKMSGKAPARILTPQPCFSDEDNPDLGSNGSANDRFAALVGATPGPSFAPSHGFSQLYMNRRFSRSGTMWFNGDNGACCAVGFSTHTLAYDEVSIGRLGRIQFFLSRGCDDDHVAAVLESMCALLKKLDCSFVSLVDQQCISQQALARSGFEKTPDEVTFYLWVPMPLAERFKDVRPPCAVDFL